MYHFTSNEVCTLTGASFKTLHGWLGRKQFQPSAGQPGTGNRVAYTVEDVIQVSFLHELSRVGIGPGKAAKVWACVVQPNILQADFRIMFGLRDDDSDVDWRLVRPGESDGLGKPGAPAVSATVDMGQLVRGLADKMPAVIAARVPA